jgi:hypothetical protein
MAPRRLLIHQGNPVASKQLTTSALGTKSYATSTGTNRLAILTNLEPSPPKGDGSLGTDALHCSLRRCDTIIDTVISGWTVIVCTVWGRRHWTTEPSHAKTSPTPPKQASRPGQALNQLTRESNSPGPRHHQSPSTRTRVVEPNVRLLLHACIGRDCTDPSRPHTCSPCSLYTSSSPAFHSRSHLSSTSPVS